jgi:hypothetical protein
MIDLEEIRERSRKLKELLTLAASEPPCRYRVMLHSLLDDAEQLIREIDGLRSLCSHQHLIQVFDEAGAPTDAHSCVNCHQTFSKDNPLPEPDDFV